MATTIAGTREALAMAAALARAQDGQIHVIAARSAPSRWSFDRQAAPVQAFAREIRKLAEESSLRVEVLPCVCRRLMEVAQVLPAGGLVIVGGRSHRWWSTREQRLAHELDGLGYRVMFIHTRERRSLRR